MLDFCFITFCVVNLFFIVINFFLTIGYRVERRWFLKGHEFSRLQALTHKVVLFVVGIYYWWHYSDATSCKESRRFNSPGIFEQRVDLRLASERTLGRRTTQTKSILVARYSQGWHGFFFLVFCLSRCHAIQFDMYSQVLSSIVSLADVIRSEKLSQLMT